MSTRNLVLWAVVAATVLLTSTGWSATRTREWTDQKGRTIKAKFVRTHEGEAILNRSGKIIRVPLGELSDADQAYIDRLVAANKPRTWKYSPQDKPSETETLHGKLLRFSDGVAHLRGSGKTVAVPFDQLSYADQTFVRDHLVAQGREKELPAMTRDADGETGTGPAHKSDQDDDNPFAADKPATAKKSQREERAWTDSRKRKIRARLLRVEGKDVVLLRDGREFHVPLANLSQADQQYVQDETGTSQRIVRNNNARTSRPIPSRNSRRGYSGGARGGSTDPFADMRRRHEQSMREQEARMAESRERSRRALDESLARSRAATERSIGQPTFPEPRIAGRRSDFNGSAPPRAARRQRTVNDRIAQNSDIRIPTAPSRMPVEIEQMACSGCYRAVPASTKAGDTCPHCGIYFAYTENADGTKNRAPAYDPRSWGLSYRGIGFIVLCLISMIAAAAKKLNG